MPKGNVFIVYAKQDYILYVAYCIVLTTTERALNICLHDHLCLNILYTYVLYMINNRRSATSDYCKDRNAQANAPRLHHALSFVYRIEILYTPLSYLKHTKLCCARVYSTIDVSSFVSWDFEKKKEYTNRSKHYARRWCKSNETWSLRHPRWWCAICD